MPLIEDRSRSAFMLALAGAARSRSQAPHAPRIPRAPCVARLNVKISGCEAFATLERSRSFATGKSFTINVPDEGPPSARAVPWAADAVASGVASAEDVELAMRLGVNYPRGPIAWGQQWGTRTVLTILDSLENWYRDGRYRAAPALRRAVLAGGGPMTGMGGSGASLPLPRNPSR